MLMASSEPHIEGLHGGSAEEHSPEPDGKVGCVEVGAKRGAVAADGDRLVVDGVADEVADGEVGVEGEVGADEGEATGDLDFDCGALRQVDAHLLGGAFAFGVNVVFVGRIGLVGLRDVSDGGRLFAVDCAGTGEEQLPGVVRGGEVEGAGGALEDSGEHLFGIFGLLLCAGLGGGVDYERDVAGGKAERANVPYKEGEGWVGGEVRALAGEGCGVVRVRTVR